MNSQSSRILTLILVVRDTVLNMTMFLPSWYLNSSMRKIINNKKINGGKSKITSKSDCYEENKTG